MGKKLYVGNLSFSATQDDLNELFAQVGTVDYPQTRQEYEALDLERKVTIYLNIQDDSRYERLRAIPVPDIVENTRAARGWEDLYRWLPISPKDIYEIENRHGLRAAYAGRPVLALARELADLASEGLRRIGHAGRNDRDERPYLEPIFEQLERGVSPGELVLERWEGEWNRSPDRLLDYARY